MFSNPVSVWASLAGRGTGIFLPSGKPSLCRWSFLLLSPPQQLLCDPQLSPLRQQLLLGAVEELSEAGPLRLLCSKGPVPVCRQLFPVSHQHLPAAGLFRHLSPARPLPRRRGSTMPATLPVPSPRFQVPQPPPCSPTVLASGGLPAPKPCLGLAGLPPRATSLLGILSP